MEPEKIEHRSNVALVVLLVIIILGLGGYIVYDKFIKTNDTLQNNNENTNENNNQNDNDNTQASTVPLEDTYAIKYEGTKLTLAYIANNKLYYTQKNTADYSDIIYSGSKSADQDVVMKTLSETGNISRIKSCFFNGEAGAPIYLIILSDGTVKELATDFGSVTLFNDLSSYKISNMTCEGHDGESYDSEAGYRNYTLTLKDGSTKTVRIES